MTPLVSYYGSIKHCSCESICQSIAVLFQGVRIGFKCITFWKNLTVDDFGAFMSDLALESSSTILEVIFGMEFEPY
jgi:hypothetical protein